ncbi:glycerol-3-phosphate dehydrogenase [Mycoplasma cottewii]|uniref:Glycerol-3-phosphate dehydrogenase n=1 Tax=Mycoplasma cottewii TaxID=51364 RepID=A0ABY5TXQ5_9MOLU|nr:glycerol-3-phosphate dehydrogenase [Mycoplasma cottewii]UWD35427.1 glycerol-3-phosphate dehydrogenase [Mycoplasma cottewii]
MSKNITIIGCDDYATSLANVLADNHHKVIIYTNDEDIADQINYEHKNSKFLNDLKINQNIKATDCIVASLENCEVLVLASKKDQNLIQEIINYAKRKMIIVDAYPSLKDDLTSFSTDIINIFKTNDILKDYAVIFGANKASEIVKKQPTCFNVCSTDIKSAKSVANIFDNEYFNCLISQNILSCEIANSFSKVFALCGGILTGLECSINTCSSLFTIIVESIDQVMKNFNNYSKDSFLNFATLSSFLKSYYDNESLEFKLGLMISKLNDTQKAIEELNYNIENLNILINVEKMCKTIKKPLIFFILINKILYNNNRPISLLNKVFTAFKL